MEQGTLALDDIPVVRIVIRRQHFGRSGYEIRHYRVDGYAFAGDHDSGLAGRSKRGVYSGAVGYISFTGNMDTAIAIRTAVIKDKTLHIQAGAGIVYDSVPENEWKETMNKGRAIFKAVQMVEGQML